MKQSKKIEYERVREKRGNKNWGIVVVCEYYHALGLEGLGL